MVSQNEDEFLVIILLEKQEPLKFLIDEPMKIFTSKRMLDILSHHTDDMHQHIIRNLFLSFLLSVLVHEYILKLLLQNSLLKLQNISLVTIKYQEIISMLNSKAQ